MRVMSDRIEPPRFDLGLSIYFIFVNVVDVFHCYVAGKVTSDPLHLVSLESENKKVRMKTMIYDKVASQERAGEI